MIRAATWMARGSLEVAPKPPVPRTVLPNVGEVSEVLGAGNHAVFATLNASPRNWNCSLSRIGNVLNKRNIRQRRPGQADIRQYRRECVQRESRLLNPRRLQSIAAVVLHPGQVEVAVIEVELRGRIRKRRIDARGESADGSGERLAGSEIHHCVDLPTAQRAVQEAVSCV